MELIDATDEFFTELAGITEPELKRKTIGRLFVESFVKATDQLKSKFPSGTLKDAFLLQGTLYPDVIESISFKGPSHTIKTHHNVGGLPDVMELELLEPLRELFKGHLIHTNTVNVLLHFYSTSTLLLLYCYSTSTLNVSYFSVLLQMKFGN